MRVKDFNIWVQSLRVGCEGKIKNALVRMGRSLGMGNTEGYECG